jgi:hypothetical protein
VGSIKKKVVKVKALISKLNIRMLHAENLPELMTRDMFDGYCCDVCSAVFDADTPLFYHALNISSTCDLCAECFATIPQHINPMLSNDAGFCDVCLEKQNDDFHRIGEGTETGTGINACGGCTNHIKDQFVPIHANGELQLMRTDGDMTLQCKQPAASFIPNKIKSRISAEGNEEYMHSIFMVVKVPSSQFNALEWTLISGFAMVPGRDIGCAFALRCVEGSNQVASVVWDENERVAFDIVYEDVEEFLREESEWRSGKGTDADIDREEEAISARFAAGGSCDINTVVASTGSFAVFKRLDSNLALDYGWVLDW